MQKHHHTLLLKSSITLIGGVLWLVALTGCEQLFIPDIDPQTPVLVVEGLITDQNEEHFVRISYSAGYNDNLSLSGVSGLAVNIQEMNGPTYVLTEKSKGYYVTSTQVKGQIGKLYRTIITDAQGVQYVSAYDTLLEAAPINAITGTNHVESWLEKNESGSYIEIQQPGVLFMSNLKPDTQTPYYRYEYNLVLQTTQTYPTVPFQTLVYIAQPISSKSRGLAAIANANEFQQKNVTDLPVDYLTDDRAKMRVILDSIEYDTATNEYRYNQNEITFYQHGFMVQLWQYSLTKPAYDFWEGIKKQIDASGHLFDPVEARINGNIVCQSDSTINVFGYFGASAVTGLAKHLYKRYDNRVVIKDITYFPELAGDTASYQPFDFWIRN